MTQDSACTIFYMMHNIETQKLFFFLEKKNSGSPRDDKDHTHDLDSAPEIRDVFGDFDDEEEDMGYAAQQDIEQDSNVSVS